MSNKHDKTLLKPALCSPRKQTKHLRLTSAYHTSETSAEGLSFTMKTLKGTTVTVTPGHSDISTL